ncbi:MAG: PAS domain S-box protein [Leptospiraceae bacterium]|nr:PAS domain S-box protein [Leptospiraceae bacterium]
MNIASFLWAMFLLYNVRDYRLLVPMGLCIVVGIEQAIAFHYGVPTNWVDLTVSTAVFLSVFVLSRSIAANLRADDLLSGKDTRISTLLDTAVDAIVIIDERGLVESFNPAAERLFGYTAGEVIRSNVNMLMPEPDRSHHNEYIHNFLSSRQPRIIGKGREVTGRRKDGTNFPVYLAVSEMLISGKRYFVGTLHDQTEIKRKEAELRQEKNFIAAILDTASALVIVLDRHGRIVSFNRSCEQLSGYTTEEIQGRTFWEQFIPINDRPYVQEVLRKLVETRQTGHFETYWITRSGNRRYVEWENSILKSDSGEVDFIIATGIDITEKRIQQQAISQLSSEIMRVQEEERKRIAGDLHDSLGQSLVALKFMIEELRYSNAQNAELQNQCDRINDFINGIVQDARELSHTLSPISLQKIGLKHAIRELVNSHRSTGIDISLEIDEIDDFFPENWDINLYRIIQEALTNVFKHSGATSVIIQAHRTPHGLSLLIQDNGSGFQNNRQHRGMGLLIMQERARALDGNIQTVSAPQAGTEVKVEIPAR